MSRPTQSAPWPPFTSTPAARKARGADGLRELLAWAEVHFAAPYSLLDAARAMEPGCDDARAKMVAQMLRRAARSIAYPLTPRPRGAPKGSVAYTRACERKARGPRAKRAA